jgi:hypothetical protein
LPGGHHSPLRNCAFHGALEVGLDAEPEEAQVGQRDLRRGEDGGWSSQEPLYWIGEGESADGLHRCGVQPDAAGDDLGQAPE